MKASDYIVEFLIQHGIHDVFGYPGGMVTHLMDSLDRYKGKIRAHVNYHEQASAMAACGWAEITGLPGVAYATSGPGATNLLTGIACAYFDSLPCVFITGQVNTYEQRGEMGVRQRGFQETDITPMARPITKLAFSVRSASELPQALEHGFRTAMEGRPGPVLLDIPMNISRDELEIRAIPVPGPDTPFIQEDAEYAARELISALQAAKRPVVLAGHGIHSSKKEDDFLDFIHTAGLPVVTSMNGMDLVPSDWPERYGMIGAYGARQANYIVNHSDCILSLGSRLDCRQTGVNRSIFAPSAKLLRVDLDPAELEYSVHSGQYSYQVPLESLLPILSQEARKEAWEFSHWRNCCHALRRTLARVDEKEPGAKALEELSALFPEKAVITVDVGQNQVWSAQSLRVKKRQRVLFSGGMGAMGYSLPAAIGAALASGGPAFCICGDGGFQMNIQELQFIAREKLPVKIILLNNRALGMIHHFQEMYFSSNYAQTEEGKGYSVPDFTRIVQAYGIRVVSPEERELASVFSDKEPAFLEVPLPSNTHVTPKLGMNRPIHLQEPPLSEELLEKLEKICRGEEETL